MPHRPLRLRRSLDLRPHRPDQRLLPVADGGEVGLAELERTQAVPGQDHPQPDDAAHRHGPGPGQVLQEVRRKVRQGRPGLLRRLFQRRHEAVRAGRAFREQAGGPHQVQTHH